MCENNLSLDVLRNMLHYDENTGVFTWNVRRNKIKAGSVAGTPHPSGYWRICIFKKIYRAHRLAWFYVHGTFPPDDIDHINRIRSDNRISNLRAVTRAVNHQNRSMYKNNKTGVTGVYYIESENNFVAYINTNKVKTYIGRFKTLKDAASARAYAKTKYHVAGFL